MGWFTNNDVQPPAMDGKAPRIALALYAGNGLGIEVLSDMASLLNPVGGVLVRLPSTIGEINFRNLRIRGSNDTSFGSVTIRDVNFGGTMIRVIRR